MAVSFQRMEIRITRNYTSHFASYKIISSDWLIDSILRNKNLKIKFGIFYLPNKLRECPQTVIIEFDSNESISLNRLHGLLSKRRAVSWKIPSFWIPPGFPSKFVRLFVTGLGRHLLFYQLRNYSARFLGSLDQTPKKDGVINVRRFGTPSDSH